MWRNTVLAAPSASATTYYCKLDARANVRAKLRIRVRVSINAVICCRCCWCGVSSHPTVHYGCTTQALPVYNPPQHWALGPSHQTLQVMCCIFTWMANVAFVLMSACIKFAMRGGAKRLMHYRHWVEWGLRNGGSWLVILLNFNYKLPKLGSGWIPSWKRIWCIFYWMKVMKHIWWNNDCSSLPVLKFLFLSDKYDTLWS